MMDLLVSTGNCLQRQSQFHDLNITLCGCVWFLCFPVRAGWVTKYVTGKKRKAHSPKHSVCHRPLAVQAMGDISLSADRIHNDSKDPHDYFPLATPREKLFLSGNLGSS